MDPITLLIQVALALALLAVIWILLERVFKIDYQLRVIIMVILAVIVVIYLVRAARWI